MTESRFIPLSEPERLEAAGAGTWAIGNIILEDMSLDTIFVDTKLLSRWKNYIIGLGSFSVESAPDAAFQSKEDTMKLLGRDLGKVPSKARIQNKPGDLELPSGYRRPHGSIIINEDMFGIPDAEDAAPAAIEMPENPEAAASEASEAFSAADGDETIEAVFAQYLDRTVRGGLLELFRARYYGPQAMSLPERMSGPAPLVLGISADLAGANPLLSSALWIGTYAAALGADYYDARTAPGGDEALSAFQLKRWSIAPCGVPIERKAELYIRALPLLRNKPKPKIVHYKVN